MRSSVRLLALILLLLTAMLLASCSLASPAPVEQPRSQTLQPTPALPLELPTRHPSVSEGAALFQQKCVGCHGTQGRGDGEMAAQIQTQFGNPVADLTTDVVARATTPEQWYNVVSSGQLQKGMPGFADSLDVNQRWDVIAYAWSLASPPDDIAHGKDVYTTQCAQCHGATGKGDGKDAQGQLPDFSNFATLAQIEPGRWDQALSSAHVPSFAGTLSEGDRRAAVDYVRTFAFDYAVANAAANAAANSAAPTTPATGTGSLTATSQLPANPAGPAAPIEITGNLVNGTAGMSVPDNLTMTLYLLPHQNTSQDMITRTFYSGVGGHFSITETQANTATLLAVGVDYKDLSFFSQVVAAEPSVTLPITIYENTPDPSKVKIDTLHLIVSPSANGLDVSEIYVLSNSGDKYVAGFGAPVMHFALPAGATNLQMDATTQNVLTRGGDGLDYYDAVPVGQKVQQVVYQYSLPAGTTALNRMLYNSIGSVNLLVSGDPNTIGVSSDQLTPQGSQVIQGNTYQQYTATNLQSGQTLTMSVGAVSGVDWRIILGIALVVVGVVGIVIWQRSQRKRPVAEARSLDIQKDALIDEIAALDDEFAAGKIDEVNYKARRAKMKDKLIKLMNEEH